MAELVFILGESGRGKSSSLRNFSPEEITLINVKSKRLPFRSEIKPFNLDRELKTKEGRVLNTYEKVNYALKKSNAKVIVIDDANYLMMDEEFSKISDKGFDKWNDIAAHFFTLLVDIKRLPEDVIVYVMAHTMVDNYGNERFKTSGRMIDRYSIEGLATICLKAVKDEAGYWFMTENNGSDTTKAPIGMFPSDKIENDLKAVDKTIREFFNIKETKS